ncbi:hypothetical protein [Pygmaiobacter massiliensis]|uniref:hypothetical protein n=1 Tax=Pygmaiobacter massiliensis TaxID=1917873 RepID=UPI000C7A28D4|nr:hypothetical protein [Pygmaiobacter massiliensis]
MLTLPIKKKWFDMIAAGEKLEEYRSDTPCYAARFGPAMNANGQMEICLRNGYRADSPKLYCTITARLRHGARPEWRGNPKEPCWVLTLLGVKAENERSGYI